MAKRARRQYKLAARSDFRRSAVRTLFLSILGTKSSHADTYSGSMKHLLLNSDWRRVGRDRRARCIVEQALRTGNQWIPAVHVGGFLTIQSLRKRLGDSPALGRALQMLVCGLHAAAGTLQVALRTSQTLVRSFSNAWVHSSSQRVGAHIKKSNQIPP